MLELIFVIATGPLTSDALAKDITKFTGSDGLFFFDAAAPILVISLAKASEDMLKDAWTDHRNYWYSSYFIRIKKLYPYSRGIS